MSCATLLKSHVEFLQQHPIKTWVSLFMVSNVINGQCQYAHGKLKLKFAGKLIPTPKELVGDAVLYAVDTEELSGTTTISPLKTSPLHIDVKSGQITYNNEVLTLVCDKGVMIGFGISIKSVARYYVVSLKDTVDSSPT